MISRRVFARNESGFTLIELLIAVSVTAVLSLVLFRMFTTASLSLNRSVEESNAAMQAVRFSRLLKYDVSGSDDAYIFGQKYPSNTSDSGYLSNLCSSTKGTATAATKWTVDPQSKSAFVRTLFVLRVPTIGYDPSSPTTNTFAKEDQTMTGLYPLWIGYELRGGSAAAGDNFELWRVECQPQWSADVPPVAGPKDAISSEERVAVLGTALTSTTTGQTLMSCFNRAGGLVSPPVGYTTADPDRVKTANVCSAYKFTLPYNGTRNALNRLAGSAALGDSVDEWLQRMSTYVERLG